MGAVEDPFLDAPPQEPGPRRRRVVRWFSAGVVAFLAVVIGGPWLFFHFEGKAPSEPTLPVAAGGTAGPLNGTWKVAAPSTVEYRVKEILFGLHHTAVGTTSQVRGSLTIEGRSVTAAQFTVDMGSVTSNEDGRNVQFKDEIMDTATYPNGYFTLTRTLVLPEVPPPGRVVHVDATGELTLRGKSRTVEFPLQAERFGDEIDVSGSLTIQWAQWGIPNPSFAIVKVGDTGTIAVLLHLARAGH